MGYAATASFSNVERYRYNKINKTVYVIHEFLLLLKYVCKQTKRLNMKMSKFFTVLMMCVVLFTSCVSKKVLKGEQDKYNQLQTQYGMLQNELKTCNELTSADARRRTQLESEIERLNKQISFLKDNNNQALKQLENLSVISSSQAESIKKSMENIGAKDSYIQTLQQQMAHKDSLNMALVMNLKGAIGDLNDQDINIKVDKGVVYIDISDKLLFKTAKYNVTPEA